MKERVLKSIGYSIRSWGENLFSTIKGDNLYGCNGDSFILSMVVPQTVPIGLETIISSQDSSEFSKKILADYQASSGRKYPKLYKVKVIAEVEELSDEDSNAAWEAFIIKNKINS